MEVQLSNNALKVLESRYLLRDKQQQLIETPVDLFRRVAKAVAQAELKWGDETTAKRWEANFYSLMSELLFLPNSPTLMNAGTDNNQLSACFVLPVEDNMDKIFSSLRQAALIQQSGGGTGFNFSHLRPKNDLVSSGSGTASGPVSFMKIFNEATEHIKQGGKRRGANMGILNIDHPDIEEFITAKKHKQGLNNFNISVGITDDFMKAVNEDSEWQLVHPNSKATVQTIAARKLWQLVCETAWLTGDPGLVFLDTINHENPLPKLGKIESTNPCGEVPLLSYEPCNLGSINLPQCIHSTTNGNEIDWRKLAGIVTTAIRFLDDVIDVNNYILPEIKEMALANRKIGLGVMGWAEMLIQLNIPYASNHAVQLAAQLIQFIHLKATAASKQLAEEREAFPNWSRSNYWPHIKMRNATVTSIAPTGTISIVANTSSSIEPLFALAFQRKHVLNEETLFTLNTLVMDELNKRNLLTEDIIQQIQSEGTLENIPSIPHAINQLFKTALEIEPYWHLEHQLAFQRYTDNAVSKTINLPENASTEDIASIFYTAWEKKAKGITVFRYHSKGKQVMHRGIQRTAQPCKVCIE